LKFREFDKPVIAAVNGLAIGAGFTLPLACADLIYLAEEAYLRFPFFIFPRSGMRKLPGDKKNRQGIC
jgi:enoyl-CoA hydratase/carnithine racemase